MAGCTAGQRGTAGDSRALWDTVAAERVVVVGPFTRPASFDKDPVPDGLEVVLQPLDHEGEPTKIAGHLLFELYDYRPASAERKGQLLQSWEMELASRKDQAAYWNRATRMYEFPLAVDLKRLSQQPKYVLVARYANPWDEYLEDQLILDLAGLAPAVRDQLRRAVSAESEPPESQPQ